MVRLRRKTARRKVLQAESIPAADDIDVVTLISALTVIFEIFPLFVYANAADAVSCEKATSKQAPH
mgnify:CR=1 FL=1